MAMLGSEDIGNFLQQLVSAKDDPWFMQQQAPQDGPQQPMQPQQAQALQFAPQAPQQMQQPMQAPQFAPQAPQQMQQPMQAPQQPQDGGYDQNILQQAYQKAGVGRKRNSLFDILGGIADAFSTEGGGDPNYQNAQDNELARARAYETDMMDRQKFGLDQLKGNAYAADARSRIVGPLAEAALKYVQGGGDINNVLPTLYRTLGLSPDEIQQYDPDLRAHPVETLSMLSRLGKEGKADWKSTTVYDAETQTEQPGWVIAGQPKSFMPQGDPVRVKQPSIGSLYRLADGTFATAEEAVGQPGYRAPTAGSRPDAYERKVEALRTAGVPEDQIPAIASGLADSPLKPKTSGGSKYAQDEQRRLDAYEAVVSQMNRMSKTGLLDNYAGADYVATKIAQPFAGLVGGTTGEQTRKLEVELAQFKQNVRKVVNPESNYESKQLWERLAPLFPELGPGKSGEDIRRDFSAVYNLLVNFMEERQGDERAPTEGTPDISLEDARSLIQGGGGASRGRLKFNPQTGKIE